MTDESETDRLLATDVAGLSGPELLAHLDAVEDRVRQLLRTQRDLLEASAGRLADQPELQARLDYLRTVDLDDPSASGS
ncbi:MAG TPA: hypothetical protein VG497_07350 [Kribbella sp.]|nr:hypothetical protein [Kribbella sp.]